MSTPNDAPGRRAEAIPSAARAELDSALLDAHAKGDGARLAALYTSAADMAEAEGRVDAACFFLTQAYVFALDQGDAAASALHARLLAHGREE